MQQQVFGEFVDTRTTQVQFLNLMAHKPEFFRFAASDPIRMTHADFTVTACQLIYEVLGNYYRRYSQAPKMGTLADMVADAVNTGQGVDTQITGEEYESLASVLYGINQSPDIDDDYARTKLFDYVKNLRGKNLITQYQEALGRGLPTNDLLDKLSQVQSMKPPTARFDMVFLADADSQLIIDDDEERRVPTGLKELDDHTLGGLSATHAELGVAIACTGTGKTNFLLNTALGASMAGVHTLFISLEMLRKKMALRYISMAAHINARHAFQPISTWEDSEIKRYEYFKTLRTAKAVTFVEMIGEYSVSDVFAAISQWKEQERKLYGTDEQCRLVCLDWLGWLAPDLRGVKVQSYKRAQWETMSEVTKQLQRDVLTPHRVAMWSAAQGNRQSASAMEVRLGHTGGSFDQLHPVSVAAGISAPNDDLYAKEGVDDDNTNVAAKMDCNRTLTFAITKNRDGPHFKHDFYQGPTLRIWSARSHWFTTERMMKEGNLRRLFGGVG